MKHVQDRKNVMSHIQTVRALGPVFLKLIISSILSNMFDIMSSGVAMLTSLLISLGALPC